MATVVHWHGIRLPAAEWTDNTQRPIQPGEEFEYHFTGRALLYFNSHSK